MLLLCMLLHTLLQLEKVQPADISQQWHGCSVLQQFNSCFSTLPNAAHAISCRPQVEKVQPKTSHPWWIASTLLQNSLFWCARAAGLQVEKVQPKASQPAYLEVCDIAGLVKGAAEGQGLGNAFLSNIAAVDGERVDYLLEYLLLQV